jgi:hypothetical protein
MISSVTEMSYFRITICFFLIIGVSLAALDEKYVKRTGVAPRTHSCGKVIPVPEDVRKEFNLDPWYEQYTETYGVPILGSNVISKQALTRACYMVRYLFAGNILTYY